jgi:CRP-like cAMP-binding protein
MSVTASKVALLAVEPDIGRFLSEDDRAEVRRVLMVPVRNVFPGELDLAEFLDRADAFGGLLLDGMLVMQVGVGEQVALRLLGPGDLTSCARAVRGVLLSDASCVVLSSTRMALLGRTIEHAAQRWPGLLAGLYAKLAEQQDRLATQLAICQLPRVEDRLLAALWLIAEQWGHVTPSGTALPLTLTHDVLGGLVGARRSTVTLALGALSERGAVIRQEERWLLIEPPPAPVPHPPQLEGISVIETKPSQWSEEVSEAPPDASATAAMRDTIQRLREQHIRAQEDVRLRLERMARMRRARAQHRRLHGQ